MCCSLQTECWESEDAKRPLLSFAGESRGRNNRGTTSILPYSLGYSLTGLACWPMRCNGSPPVMPSGKTGVLSGVRITARGAYVLSLSRLPCTHRQLSYGPIRGLLISVHRFVEGNIARAKVGCQDKNKIGTVGMFSNQFQKTGHMMA